MRRSIFSGLLILVLSLMGCVSEYNIVLPENTKKVLFIDGNIVGNTESTFHISQSFSLDIDTIPEEIFIDRATLTIIGSNGYISPPATNQGKGVYRISLGELEDDVEYGIQVKLEGDTYQSTLSKPIYTPAIDSVSWIQPDPEGTVFFHISTHDATTKEARYLLWNYTEDWEIAALIPTSIFFNPQYNTFYEDHSLPYRYCWKKNRSGSFLLASTESLRENRIINQSIYEQDPASDRFSMLYSVTVTQRAISKNAYEYYQNIIKLNEEMGGLFTPQPSEMAGNITCITDSSKKAMGYIETTKNISQERIFIDRAQLSRPFTYSKECVTTDNNAIIGMFVPGQAYVSFYRMGYRPAGGANPDLSPGVILPKEWAPSTCTDCTAMGGTKNKPDFWPNWHQ